MFSLNRFLTALTACAVIFSAQQIRAQSYSQDTRQEYVRSSSPTQSGGRVFNESVAGQRMVRIARGPASPAKTAAAEPDTIDRDNLDRDKTSADRGGYDYPEPMPKPQDPQDSQVTAYRQAANQAPQLNFPPNNRLAQCNCNCNGIPTPPQQLQFPQYQTQPQFTQPINYTGFQTQPTLQAPTGFQPQANFGAQGYPLRTGIGVPQFNQTGGNWWAPFFTGSGYYTPLLNFRNMPPGTYLGQGIIGQPTAYVDGQPARNLLRYVSP